MSREREGADKGVRWVGVSNMQILPLRGAGAESLRSCREPKWNTSPQEWSERAVV